jgi:hypothetical protein
MGHNSKLRFALERFLKQFEIVQQIRIEPAFPPPMRERADFKKLLTQG